MYPQGTSPRCGAVEDCARARVRETRPGSKGRRIFGACASRADRLSAALCQCGNASSTSTPVDVPCSHRLSSSTSPSNVTISACGSSHHPEIGGASRYHPSWQYLAASMAGEASISRRARDDPSPALATGRCACNVRAHYAHALFLDGCCMQGGAAPSASL